MFRFVFGLGLGCCFDGASRGNQSRTNCQHLALFRVHRLFCQRVRSGLCNAEITVLRQQHRGSCADVYALLLQPVAPFIRQAGNPRLRLASHIDGVLIVCAVAVVGKVQGCKVAQWGGVALRGIGNTANKRERDLRPRHAGAIERDAFRNHVPCLRLVVELI